MKKTKSQKGITLIALIITIVVLLILAAVAINAITEYNIIENANSAAQKYGDQAGIEDETLGDYNSEIDKYMGGATGGNGSGDNTGNVGGTISKTDTFIGYYADVDGDGDIDGIIYADLAVDGSGQWSDGDGAYSYEAKATLNNYTVRDATTAEQGYFKGATAKVILPVDKVEANDRFYVMALSNFTTENYTSFYWYNEACGKMDPLVTELGFGTGRENTNKIIEIWNKNGEDGGYARANQSDQDMWKHIQEEVADGWFVPSRAEWAAFANAFSITSGNYTEYGLRYYYWSSSQYDTFNVWDARFGDGYVGGYSVNHSLFVRLGTTF